MTAVSRMETDWPGWCGESEERYLEQREKSGDTNRGRA